MAGLSLMRALKKAKKVDTVYGSLWNKEALKRLCPDADVDNWEFEESNTIPSVMANTAGLLQMFKLTPSHTCFVVLDEEYEAWLENEGRADTEETEMDYIESISEEDATRLLKKNGKDEITTLCAAPVMVIYPEECVGKQTETLRLPDEICRKFEAYYKDHYGYEQVFTPGFVLTADRLMDDEDQLKRDYVDQMETGEKFTRGKWAEQERKSNVCSFFIPFIVRAHVKSALVNNPAIQELEPDRAAFPYLADPIDGKIQKEGEMLPIYYSDYGSAMKDWLNNAQVLLDDVVLSPKEAERFEQGSVEYLKDLFIEEAKATMTEAMRMGDEEAVEGAKEALLEYGCSEKDIRKWQKQAEKKAKK